MKRTVSLKLITPPEEEMMATVESFRDACQIVSTRVETGELRSNARAIQFATYHELAFLPSQMRCNVARIVAAAWKSRKANGSRGRPPSFRRAVVHYNEGRDWGFVGNLVSFRTLKRRVRVGYRTSPMGLQRIALAKECRGLKGALLVKRRMGLFLNVTVLLPDLPAYTPVTPIGVDLGVNQMAVARATDSRPLFIHGRLVRHYRDYSLRMRQGLERKGTRSAFRLLSRLSGREKRFVLNEARVAAKRVRQYAQAFPSPVLVLEWLGGIREDRYVESLSRGRRYRSVLNSWAYAVLADCIREEAEEYGIPLIFVGASCTSRTCPRCGDAREENRRGSAFHCGHCGYRNHADVVGATNLARRWLHRHAGQPWGRVNGPDGCGDGDHVPEPGGPITDAQATH